MNLRELKELKIKLKNIDEFKKIVEAALDGEGMFKEHDWINEEYTEYPKHEGDDSINYRAVILCVNTTYNDKYKFYKHKYDYVSSVKVYDIFYSDYYKGSFIMEDIVLEHSSIQAIKSLEEIIK